MTEDESHALGGVEGWRKLDDPFFAGNSANYWFDVEYEDDDEDEDEEEEHDETCGTNHSHQDCELEVKASLGKKRSASVDETKVDNKRRK